MSKPLHETNQSQADMELQVTRFSLSPILHTKCTISPLLLNVLNMTDENMQQLLISSTAGYKMGQR